MTLLLLAVALAAPPPDGAYALEVAMVSSTKAPVVGWISATTRSTSLVVLSRTEAGLQAEQSTCAVEVEGGAPARTTVPPAFIASLPRQTYPVQVNADGSLHADPGPSWVGQAPDGTVLDQEGDGHPGATIWVDVPVLGRAQIYVAQHAHTTWHGRWTGDAVQGTIEVKTMEQRTLGATHKLLSHDRPTRLEEEGSGFVLVPLAPGSEPSCAAAAQALTSHHAARSL